MHITGTTTTTTTTNRRAEFFSSSTDLGPAPVSASLGGGPAVARALGCSEVLHDPIHPRAVGAAYRPRAPRDGVCTQQLRYYYSSYYLILVREDSVLGISSAVEGSPGLLCHRRWSTWGTLRMLGTAAQLRRGSTLIVQLTYSTREIVGLTRRLTATYKIGARL